MNGISSFELLRLASGLASSAVSAVRQQVADLGERVSEPTFAEILASPVSDPGIDEIRQELATAVESLLARIGVPADPPLTFVASLDGQLRLQGEHVRGAEIEANLRDDASIRRLASKLTRAGAGADCRITVPGDPSIG